MVTQFPLSASPNQSFQITVSGDKKNYTFNITMSYNALAGYWVMGLYDNTNTPIILGIPILCGANLLEQYGYLGIGEIYVVNIGDQSIEAPDDQNIANNFALLWVINDG